MSYFSIKVSYTLYIFKLFKNYIHVFRSMTIENFLWRTLSLAYSSFGVNSLAYAFVTLKSRTFQQTQLKMARLPDVRIKTPGTLFQIRFDSQVNFFGATLLTAGNENKQTVVWPIGYFFANNLLSVCSIVTSKSTKSVHK